MQTHPHFSSNWLSSDRPYTNGLSTYWLLVIFIWPFNIVAQPLFDNHLHYSAADARAFSPEQFIAKLDRNNIRYAAVTSTPADHVSTLYQHAPERIVPLLGIYRKPSDKASWPYDTSLPGYIEEKLKRPHWSGIGELHLFAKDRHSEVFSRILVIAASRQLPLLMHGDPAVIDTIYDKSPEQTVIWAHAGTYPYPDLIADYLERYPLLYIDMSMRDERIMPGGTLDDSWYELFMTFPDRFMVGVDTYSQARWQNFDASVSGINHWLAQLPEDVASKLAYANAARLYRKPD